MQNSLRAQSERNRSVPLPTSTSGFASKQRIDPVTGELLADPEQGADGLAAVDGTAVIPSDPPDVATRTNAAADAVSAVIGPSVFSLSSEVVPAQLAHAKSGRLRLGPAREFELRYNLLRSRPDGSVIIHVTGPDGSAFPDRLDITSAVSRGRCAQRLEQRFPELAEHEVATALEGFAADVVSSGAMADPAADNLDEPCSPVDQLAALVLDEAELFHTPGRHDRDAYARHSVGGHPANSRVTSTQFKHWIVARADEWDGRTPSRRTIKDAIEVLISKALYKSPERTVAVRLYEHNAELWIDLGDAEWRAIKVTNDGWEVVASENVPVCFVRPAGMRALPMPARGGNINELRRFVNVRDDADWTRLLVCLVGWLRAQGPYIILAINGEQGSAKSSLSRMLRALIDPDQVPANRPARSTRDLAIAAKNSWMVSLENLSHPSQAQSDDLCALSTGGGFGTRELHSDDEERLFDATRPVIRVLPTLDGRFVLGVPTIFHRAHERTIVMPLVAEDRRHVADAVFAELRRLVVLP